MFDGAFSLQTAERSFRIAELPPGWETELDGEGRRVYVFHEEQSAGNAEAKREVRSNLAPTVTLHTLSPAPGPQPPVSLCVTLAAACHGAHCPHGAD